MVGGSEEEEMMPTEKFGRYKAERSKIMCKKKGELLLQRLNKR